MSEKFRILVINPGSTSTKIAVFEETDQVFSESVTHPEDDLRRFQRISDQHGYRKEIIMKMLDRNSIELSTIDAVVGRGGLLDPVTGGTYIVSDRMVRDLMEARRGEHACNLGGIIAREIADETGFPSFIVDPVVVDEMEPVARISGMPELERRSIFHALNQKAVARKAAQALGRTYAESNFIVAHMGGGISIGAHRRGRVVDVNNAFDGDGPFAPERAGALPAGQLVEMCFKGEFDEAAMKTRLVGNAGMVAHLGTNDMRKTKVRMEAGDEKAGLIYEAMAYQVAKEVGRCAAVLKGDVDGIVFSGGLANDDQFIDKIREHVEWIGKVFIFPGEEEMESLALGALRVLCGKEEAGTY